MMTVEEVADKMYAMIAEAKGKKKYTPRELQSAAMEKFGDQVDKKICKAAVADLNSSGKCTYSMYGGVNYLEIVE
jgi:hypothetical protein